jgi:hypothetical protein
MLAVAIDMSGQQSARSILVLHRDVIAHAECILVVGW